MVLASEAGLLSAIKLLIEYKYFLDIADKYGWTPLMSAAACGRIDIVKFLCSKGAGVNLKEQMGRPHCTLLHRMGIKKLLISSFSMEGLTVYDATKEKHL